MSTEEQVAAGLLDWINGLSVSSPVAAIDDLADGVVLWKVLRWLCITPYLFPADMLQNG